MHAIQNLIDLLICNGEDPRKGITHILGDDNEVHVSYHDLYNRAQGVLGALQRHGLRKGDELVFQLESNAAFHDLFWACLMGGIVAVPISVGKHDEHRRKLFNVWKRLNHPYLVMEENAFADLLHFATSDHLAEVAQGMQQRSIALEQLYVAACPGEIYQAAPDDLAFIQFSSGSTGDSKGVMLTHDNLLTNVFDIVQGAGLRAKEDSFLSWMPLTHDMGLVGFHLLPMATFADQYIMPTALFVRRPILWLKKAHEHKATVLSSPNFGYRYFLLNFTPELAAGWDLSHIRVIFNGAEPISASLCDEFLEALKPLGLKRTAMFTVYGLAEASVAVSIPAPGGTFVSFCADRDSLGVGQSIREMSDPTHRNAILLVDEGYPILHCAVRIADAQNQPVGEMVVGHIQMKGRNVTKGYYNDPDATARVMTPDGWLDTGDLGCMRSGRLVVTGRAKDIIFVDGQNYYAHDIERVVEPLEGLGLGKVAACGVYSVTAQRDEIILFVVHKKSLTEFAPLALQIKRQVGQQMGLAVKDVVPLRSIPRTTSGKLQRYKLAEQYRTGHFDDVLAELHRLIAARLAAESDSPLTPVERTLLEICYEVFGSTDIGLHQNLSDYGANSLLLTQIHARVDACYPGQITLANLFAYPSVAKLAYFIDHGGTISLPHVTLPDPYVVQAHGDQGTATLKVTLEGSRYQMLSAAATAESIEPDLLLLGVYLYLLSEITGNPHVGVQALIGPESDRIVSVALNLAEIEDVATLFAQIADRCSSRVGATAYPVRDIGKIRLTKARAEVLPLFLSRRFLTVNVRLTDAFDLVMEVDHGDGQVTCTCELNQSRLRKTKVTELLTSYLQLLDHLLAQYAKSLSANR